MVEASPRGEIAGSVNTWEVYFYGMKEELWNLELDTELNWKIVHNSGFLLEESVVPLLDGYEIVFVLFYSYCMHSN